MLVALAASGVLSGGVAAAFAALRHSGVDVSHTIQSTSSTEALVRVLGVLSTALFFSACAVHTLPNHPLVVLAALIAILTVALATSRAARSMAQTALSVLSARPWGAPPTLAEVVLGDCLTSISRAVGSNAGNFVLVISLVPFVLRLFQCMAEAHATRRRTPIFNAFKYSLAIASMVSGWASVAVVYCACACVWDTFMDWRIESLVVELNGKSLVFLWLSAVSNILLRVWSLVAPFESVSAPILEALRRSIWTYYRLVAETHSSPVVIGI